MTATPKDFRVAAEYYIGRGWPVFPVHGLIDASNCTCGDPSCALSNRGKHPATAHGHLDATLDPEQIESLWSDLVTRNIAIATGQVAHLVVVDIDPRNGGLEAWQEFEDAYPDVDFKTHRITTGGGGFHYYYWTDVPTPTMPNLLRGVDLKADGGYVLAPPSTHISGGIYATVQPAPAVLSPVPEPVLEIIKTGNRPTGLKHTPAGRVSSAGMTAARQREIMDDPSLLGPGERDTFFAFTARDLRRADVSFHDAVRTLGDIYDRMSNPGDDSFTPEQMLAKVERAFATIDPEPTRENLKLAQGIIASTFRSVEDATADETSVEPADNEIVANLLDSFAKPKEIEAPPSSRRVIVSTDGFMFPDEIWEVWQGERPVPWAANDDGIAALAQAQWGHRLRYDLDTKAWLFYDSNVGHWIENADAQATELMKLTVHSIGRILALDTDDTGDQERLVMFSNKSLNDGAVRAALRSLSTREGIRLRHNELDNPGHSLPVENGVIEPNFFGEEYADIPFHLHRPEDLFTRHSNLKYDEQASSPTWEGNVLKWFPDPDVRSFVKRLIGYAVFGSGQEKVFVVAHGPRDSGKSAFFNNMRDFLGDFATTLNADSVTKKRNPDPNHFDLAKIGGARLILASETAHGASYDVELLKMLASGGEDAFQVRQLFANFMDVRNKGLLVIMTNHLPRNNQLDDALWSRLIILPFTAHFPKGDPGTILTGPLKQMLYDEREGILRWIVEGYAEYADCGLQPPEATRKAVENAMREEDWMSAYLQERTSGEDPGARELFRDVYWDYKSWCQEDDNEPVGKGLFGSLLSERFEKKRGGSNKVMVYGLRLLRSAPEPATEVPSSWLP